MRTLAWFGIGGRSGGGVRRGALLLPVVAGAGARLPSLLPVVAINRSLRGSSGVCVGDGRGGGGSARCGGKRRAAACVRRVVVPCAQNAI